MGSRMELVAGPAPDILVALETGDRAAFGRGDRFRPYLSLSGGMDPTWLDLFAEAARAATDLETPTDFIDARIELGPSEGRALIAERVEPAWIDAVAAIPERSLDAVAGRWIDRLEEEFGQLASEEKPWIRDLAGRLVAFCRAADRATDVIFIWEL